MDEVPRRRVARDAGSARGAARCLTMDRLGVSCGVALVVRRRGR